MSVIHLILLACVVGFLAVPTIVAFKRNHAYKWLILLLTFVPAVGWIAALIWAIVGKPATSSSHNPRVFD